MNVVLLDNILGTSLIPSIMGLMTGRMYADKNSDLLYTTVTVGTAIATASSALNFQIKSMSSSRNQLTLLTTALLTSSLIVSIASFHIIRHNFSATSPYLLPAIIRDLKITSSSEVFRYHFFADFVPGFIIFSQVQLFSLLRFDLMNRAKRKFTFGEAFILSQLVSAAYLVWALTTYTKFLNGGPFEVEQTTDILLCIGMILFGLVFLPCYLIQKHQSTSMRYSMLALGLAASYAVTQNLVKTAKISDPLTWLVDYIFSTHQRISLFSLWLSTLAACVSFSTSWSRMVGQTNNLVRKVFHLATCVVFISGYNQDIDFTSFAAGGMILVMSVLEMIRAWNLWPIGPRLERICQALRGKWDNRYLTLSHIYLLLGTMVPLWIVPASYANKLIISSGLISVGVGDTAAALIGTFLGRTKLDSKSDKTLEGFVGNILAMALFKLVWIGYTGFLDEYKFAMAAILTALVEAISCNCDNLVLPLVMIFSLEIF